MEAEAQQVQEKINCTSLTAEVLVLRSSIRILNSDTISQMTIFFGDISHMIIQLSPKK